MPATPEAERRRILDEIVAAMPAQQPPLGHRPDWGTDGNRHRAYYLAACWGFSRNPKCLSCDADVWDHLRQFIPSK